MSDYSPKRGPKRDGSHSKMPETGNQAQIWISRDLAKALRSYATMNDLRVGKFFDKIVRAGAEALHIAIPE